MKFISGTPFDPRFALLTNGAMNTPIGLVDIRFPWMGNAQIENFQIFSNSKVFIGMAKQLQPPGSYFQNRNFQNLQPYLLGLTMKSSGQAQLYKFVSKEMRLTFSALVMNAAYIRLKAQ